jgi:uncharacterized protein YaaR (DUF327 family)
MAKISGDPALLPGIQYSGLNLEAKKAKDKGNTRRAGKPSLFSLLLNSPAPESEAPVVLPGDSPEEILKNLLDDVHSYGDDLLKRPLPEELRRYKKAVRNFLKYLLDENLSLERQEGIKLPQKPWEKPKPQKTFINIKVVDQKLDALAQSVLSGQTAQLDILARVNEIKGLLVDMIQ